MTTFSSAEWALIQRYRDQIIPIADGFRENMAYLTSRFSLHAHPLDQRMQEVLTENLRFTSPNLALPFAFHSFTIHPETAEQLAYFSKRMPEQDILVILESQIGCVHCNYHRLALELHIRNTITEEDIAAQNNHFRYRVFCFSELDALNRSEPAPLRPKG